MRKTKIGWMCFSVLAFSLFCVSSPLAERIYSDDQLLTMGHDNYHKGDYMKAVMYLYAYIQRSPSLMSDPGHANQVQAALDYSLTSREAGVKGDDMSGTVGKQKPKPRLDVPSRPKAPLKVRLDGRWRCNDGGTYYLRQVGNELWWYGRSADGKSWAHVFHGTIRADRIDGRWADLPSGNIRNEGSLGLRILGNNRIHATRKTGNFGGSDWNR